MKELYTEIEINASPAKVWKILTDFEKYPEWNPFILYLRGKPEPGTKFEVSLRNPGSKPITFHPKWLIVNKNEELRWLGVLFIAGLFDGEHVFELKELSPGKTLFIQKEKFKGLLVPFLWRDLNLKTRKGFEQMNQKLKELAEEEIDSPQSENLK